MWWIEILCSIWEICSHLELRSQSISKDFCIIDPTFNDLIMWSNLWMKINNKITSPGKDFELEQITEFSLDHMFPQYMYKTTLRKQEQQLNCQSQLKKQGQK